MSGLDHRFPWRLRSESTGWVTLKKLLGLPPYDLERKADFILRSARETLPAAHPAPPEP